ncbi:hypothetical protein DFQ12_2130 [Sphingobacterium detergens]|uniref:Uncharacterized protein n=2 Tax=Sphingobacteriaceae TaxID=84566 RepID=A0A420BKK2_SPHD1|nr:hypothetical protein DFQ12_2130 [Sphingobacterium detergens]
MLIDHDPTIHKSHQANCKSFHKQDANLCTFKFKMTMLRNYQFSKNPLHYVYALIWLGVFITFAFYLFTGNMFRPENGKIHILAILIGWVVQYLGLTLTCLIILLLGIYKALRTVLDKKEIDSL